MNVSRVAREQHAAFAIARRLVRAIGPGRRELQGCQRHVRAGDAAQHCLHVLQRDRLCSMECATIEVSHCDRAWLPLREHAAVRVVTALRKLLGICELDLHGVAREFGIGAYEFEARVFADAASMQPYSRKSHWPSRIASTFGIPWPE